MDIRYYTHKDYDSPSHLTLSSSRRDKCDQLLCTESACDRKSCDRKSECIGENDVVIWTLSSLLQSLAIELSLLPAAF